MNGNESQQIKWLVTLPVFIIHSFISKQTDNYHDYKKKTFITYLFISTNKINTDSGEIWNLKSVYYIHFYIFNEKQK